MDKLPTHCQEVMRETAEEALNAMLQLKADSPCEAQRYELSAEWLDTRDGR